MALSEETGREIAARYDSGESSSELAKHYGVSHPIVMDWVRQFGRPRTRSESAYLANSSGRRNAREQGESIRKYSLDQDLFDRAFTPAMAWLLGVIAGDGCIITSRGRLCGLDIVGDKDVCAKVAAILASDMPITDKGNYGSIRFHSPKLAESLIGRGIHPRKSHTLEWPTCITAELESHFLRGFWDADGCVSFRPRSTAKGTRLDLFLSASSCSRNFMESVRIRVCRVSGAQINLIEAKSGEFIVRVSCRKARILGDWLYQESTSAIRCDRKYAKFMELR